MRDPFVEIRRMWMFGCGLLAGIGLTVALGWLGAIIIGVMMMVGAIVRVCHDAERR